MRWTSLVFFAVTAGCIVAPPEIHVTPDCGGGPGTRLRILIPETEERVTQVEFVHRNADSFGIMCSIAWPTTQVFPWPAGNEYVVEVYQDSIREIRVFRASSVVRMAVDFHLAGGHITILPDWPAVLYNKEGLEVPRWEEIGSNVRLDEFYDERYNVPLAEADATIPFEVNSGWNRGITLASQVATSGDQLGFNITLRLFGPDGSPVWTHHITDLTEFGTVVPASHVGRWTLVAEAADGSSPPTGVVWVRVAFGY